MLRPYNSSRTLYTGSAAASAPSWLAPIRQVTCALATGLALCLPVASLPAQEHRRGSLDLDAQAIVAYRRHDPVPGARALDELRVVQSALRLRGVTAGGRLVLHATADFEGATIPNGELTLGAWGEGFVDRRHPHTYLHELVLTASATAGRVHGSVSAGKGFVPFGTDDPMMRPALSYPVNHHLSQILERAVVIAGLAAGAVALEGAAFNGDEPDAPDAWPRLDRFGDSWAVRVTLRPAPAWEAQASYASVRSPEHLGGAGPPNAKWSASVRWTGRVRGTPVELLSEWARTREGERPDGFAFHSFLTEASATLGRHQPYIRFERTERPEEERVSSFRTRRPPVDDAILGISRWTLWTAGYRQRIGGPGRSVFEPFMEATFGRVRAVGGGVFDPRVYYGRRSFAALAIGVRLSRTSGAHRMGRYGVADPDSHEH